LNIKIINISNKKINLLNMNRDKLLLYLKKKKKKKKESFVYNLYIYL